MRKTHTNEAHQRGKAMVVDPRKVEIKEMTHSKCCHQEKLCLCILLCYFSLSFQGSAGNSAAFEGR